MDELADEAAFYGNNSILEILREFSRNLKLTSLLKNTIHSDNHEAVAVVKEMMDKNDVTVTKNMIDLAETRKVTKILELLRPGKYYMDQRRRRKKMLLKNKENNRITGELSFDV